MYKMYNAQCEDESSDEKSPKTSEEEKEEEIERARDEEESDNPEEDTRSEPSERSESERSKRGDDKVEFPEEQSNNSEEDTRSDPSVQSESEQSKRGDDEVEFPDEHDQERTDGEGCSTRGCSPALSLQTSGYGTHRPDCVRKDEQEGSDCRDDSSTIDDFDRESSSSQCLSETRDDEEDSSNYGGDREELSDTTNYEDKHSLAEFETRDDKQDCCSLSNYGGDGGEPNDTLNYEDKHSLTEFETRDGKKDCSSLSGSGGHGGEPSDTLNYEDKHSLTEFKTRDDELHCSSHSSSGGDGGQPSDTLNYEDKHSLTEFESRNGEKNCCSLSSSGGDGGEPNDTLNYDDKHSLTAFETRDGEKDCSSLSGSGGDGGEPSDTLNYTDKHSSAELEGSQHDLNESDPKYDLCTDLDNEDIKEAELEVDDTCNADENDTFLTDAKPLKEKSGDHLHAFFDDQDLTELQEDEHPIVEVEDHKHPADQHHLEDESDKHLNSEGNDTFLAEAKPLEENSGDHPHALLDDENLTDMMRQEDEHLIAEVEDDKRPADQKLLEDESEEQLHAEENDTRLINGHPLEVKSDDHLHALLDDKDLTDMPTQEDEQLIADVEDHKRPADQKLLEDESAEHLHAWFDDKSVPDMRSQAEDGHHSVEVEAKDEHCIKEQSGLVVDEVYERLVVEMQSLEEEVMVEKGTEYELDWEDFAEESSSNKDIKFIDSKVDSIYVTYNLKPHEEWQGNYRHRKDAVSGLEERLGGLHVSKPTQENFEPEHEDSRSQSDEQSSENDGLSAFEAYIRGMSRMQTHHDFKPKPKSFIRPARGHPHTRNLKKTDPVTKYFEYKQHWETFKLPGERDRKVLHREIREQLAYQPPPPKPRKVFVPNTYVVPTDKKRTALRWEIRNDLANGLVPPPRLNYRF